MKRAIVRFVMLYIALIPFIGGKGWVQRVMAEVSATVPATSVVSLAITMQEAESTYLADLETAHETLFPGQFDLNQSQLILSSTVSSAGVVKGTNWAGSAFTLNVVLAHPMAIADIPGLTPKQLQSAKDLKLAFTSVIALATNANGAVGLTGIAASGLDENGVKHSNLIITATVDPKSDVFKSPVSAVDSDPDPTLTNEELAALAAPELDSTTINTMTVLQQSDDCSHCTDAYNQAIAAADAAYQAAVDAAEAAYQAAVAAADATRTAALAACQATYQAAVDSAHLSMTLQITACHLVLIGAVAGCAFIGGILSIFTAGVVLALCIAAAHAAYAYCVYTAMDNYNTAMATAAAILAACTAAANAAHAAAVNAAMIAKLMAIINALNAKMAAYQAAAAARDACLAACQNQGKNSEETTSMQQASALDAVLSAM